jgi:hypothetical protein
MIASSDEVSRVSDEVFMAEVARVQSVVRVDDRHHSYAESSTAQFGLEERETQLLAIEAAYFSRAEGAEATNYWDLYEDVAERIMFGAARSLSEEGWRLRWGADTDGMNRARHGGSPASYEGMLGSKSRGLRAVIFNLANEEVLDGHGLCLRKFGRYAVAQV